MHPDEKDFILVLYTIRVPRHMRKYCPMMVGSGDPDDMHATEKITFYSEDDKVVNQVEFLRRPVKNAFSLDIAEFPEGTYYIGFLIRKYRDNNTNYFLETEEGLEALTFLDSDYNKLLTISSMNGSSAKYIDIVIEGDEPAINAIVQIGPAPKKLVEKLER